MQLGMGVEGAWGGIVVVRAVSVSPQTTCWNARFANPGCSDNAEKLCLTSTGEPVRSRQYLRAGQYLAAASSESRATSVSDNQPTERELDALKVLWQAVDAGADGATVREVAAVLQEDGEQLAYTTVLSLLQVMEQKGLVNHVRQGKAYVYRPLVERQSTFRGLAGGFLERVFDGAVGEYLVHAIEDRRLSAGELDELEAMIAKAREKQKKAKRGGVGSRKNRKRGDA